MSAKSGEQNWTRWLWVAAGIGLALLLLAQLFDRGGLPVEVASVRRGPLVVTVEEQGQTRVRDRYTVAAPITGRLLRTNADEGLSVARGDLLATMAPPPEDPRTVAMLQAEQTAAEARLREASVRLSEAETIYTQVQREAVRRAELFERGAISVETREKYDQEAESARARLDAARASVRVAEADVVRTRSRLTDIEANFDAAPSQVTSVLAPVSGKVLQVHEESERVVLAGTPLFEIGESQSLELVVDVLTEEAVPIQAGAAIYVSGWGGREVLQGRVRHVEPKAFTKISALGVEEQRVNVIGDLLDPPPSLGAAYRIEAAIVTWRGDDVLTLPTSAIFRRAGKWWTFVVDDGVARLRALELGHRSKQRAEVVDGLSEADVVILYPSDLVEDGVRVVAEASLEEPLETDLPGDLALPGGS